MWISRHTVRTWCRCPRVSRGLRISLTCFHQRFAYFDGEHELMRRTREETRALVEDGGVVRPYMDSALRHNRKRYLTFLRQLRSRDVLKFVEQARVFICLEVF